MGWSDRPPGPYRLRFSALTLMVALHVKLDSGRNFGSVYVWRTLASVHKNISVQMRDHHGRQEECHHGGQQVQPSDKLYRWHSSFSCTGHHLR